MKTFTRLVGWFVSGVLLAGCNSTPPSSTPGTGAGTNGSSTTGQSLPIRYVRQASSPNLVVFVHGVLGDSKTTWRNTATGALWSELVANDKSLSDFDVLEFGFESTLKGQGRTVADLADVLKLRLSNPNVFNTYRNVVFVCHSMGGLVVREFLNRYSQPLGLLGKVPLLYLVSVPSNGSVVAEAARAISASKQMLAMERLPDNLWLQANQQDWLANPLSRAAKTYCVVETEKTYGVMVVGRDTAIPFCTESLLTIPRNHIDIAKPPNTQDDIHAGLVAALQETVLADKSVVLSSETIDSLRTQLRAGFPLTSYVVKGAIKLEGDLSVADSWTVANLTFEPGASLLIGSRSLTIDIKGRLKPSSEGQEIVRSFAPGELVAGAKPQTPGQAGAGASPQGEGAPGNAGQGGAAGSNGADGRSSGNLTIVLRNLPSAAFKVSLIGQSGAPGGDGGQGGAGSNGTKGKAGVSRVFDCASGGGDGGAAGAGGPGGQAGLGGTPGAGGVFTIVAPAGLAGDLGTLATFDSTAAGTGEPGQPGGGGPAGHPGEGGNGSGHCGGGRGGPDAGAGGRGATPNDTRPKTGAPPTRVFQTLS